MNRLLAHTPSSMTSTPPKLNRRGSGDTIVAPDFSPGITGRELPGSGTYIHRFPGLTSGTTVVPSLPGRGRGLFATLGASCYVSAFLKLAMVLVTLAGAANAQDPMDALPHDPATSVVVAPARDTAETGEPVSVTLSFPSGGDFEEVSVEFPKDQEPQLRVGKPRREGPTRFTVEVRPLSQGELRFGPVEIKARPTGSESFVNMTGNAFTLNVPALPEAEADSMEAAAYTAPLEIPFDYFWRNIVIAAVVMLALLILIVIGVLLALLIKRRVAAALLVPPLPPIESAILAVQGLKSLDVYREFGADRHYTILSMAIRRYFEQQFGVRAVEMTEAEFENSIHHDLAHIARAESLIDATRRMSLAKFARQAVTEDVALKDCHVAETFLLMEKQRLAAEAKAAPQPTVARQAAKTPEDRAA